MVWGFQDLRLRVYDSGYILKIVTEGNKLSVRGGSHFIFRMHNAVVEVRNYNV
jgi:hypothetical protein